MEIAHILNSRDFTPDSKRCTYLIDISQEKKSERLSPTETSFLPDATNQHQTTLTTKGKAHKKRQIFAPLATNSVNSTDTRSCESKSLKDQQAINSRKHSSAISKTRKINDSIYNRDDRMLEWVYAQRKEFPNRRFYFDDSVKTNKSQMKQGIKMLGAEYVSFYDVEKVTHIVTSREVPKEDNKENKQRESHEDMTLCLPKGTSVSTTKIAQKRSLESTKVNISAAQPGTQRKKLKTPRANEGGGGLRGGSKENVNILSQIFPKQNQNGTLTTKEIKAASKRPFESTQVNISAGLQKFNVDKKLLESINANAMTDIDLAAAQRSGITVWHVDKFMKIISKLLDTSIIDPPNVDHSFLQSTSNDNKSHEKNKNFYIYVGDSELIHRPIISRQYLSENHLIRFHFDMPDGMSPFQTFETKKIIQAKLSKSLNMSNSGNHTTKDARTTQKRTQTGIIERCNRVLAPLKDEPGYCENCRKKYESLVQHRRSRTHVNFMLNPNSFKELDIIIKEL
ncbi:14817_t:CDS:2 [Acaulospora morrowiae]|uniref:14817_t:CDS:1 n=1 Tax=Acaulospora morrowiae TaxID=94023 RepID=A0A9N9HXM1_9GLOM|nr:14817_t:CDS:2 [Acaulospora morrowiae]